MKLFLPEPEIGDTDGFTPQNDLFNRKPIGDGLSHLVANVTDPVVIALDAQWGAGKTVFLKQWAGELRKAGYPVIFFDAFANDFAEDVFAAIAGQVIGLLKERKAANTTAAERFRDQALSAAKILARTGMRAGVRIATLNTVDARDLEETAKVLSEELGRLEDETLGELLTRQREHQATFDAFAGALSELPAALQGDGEPRPLIFIIDELDRCRPAFALALLERIKHFFSVPHVHFVLGVHLGQLENSVVAQYGAGIDARTYLQKFIQLTVTLKDTARHETERATPKYISHLASALQLTDPMRESLFLVGHVAKARQLSLRTLERIMTRLALADSFISDRVFAPRPLVAALVILRVLRSDLFERVRFQTLTWDDCRAPLGFDVAPEEHYARQLDLAQKWVKFVTGGSISAEDAARISQGMYQYNFTSGQHMGAWLANEVIERLEPMSKT